MIKMEYLMKEGTEVAEGSNVVECEKCHRKFIVPAGANLMAGTVCEECAAASNAEAAADMKNEQPAELKAALGN